MMSHYAISIGHIGHIGHMRIIISDCVIIIGNFVHIGYMGHIGLGS